MYKYLIYFLKAFTVFLFIYLLSKANWELCFKYFQKLSLLYLVLTFIIIYTGYLFKTIRWKNILISFEINEKTSSLIKIFLIGGYLGLITPGKIGDFGRVYYLKKHKNWKRALSSLIIDRFNDLTILLLLGGIGLYKLKSLFPNQFQIDINYKSILFIVIVISIMAFVFFKFKKKFIEFYLLIKNSSSIKNYLFQLVVTCLSMGCLYGSFAIISFDLEINIATIDIVFIGLITGILNLLPITILGIGVREASIVYLFNLYGISYDISIAFSLIIFAIQIITFLPGAYWFYKNPVDLKKAYFLK